MRGATRYGHVIARAAGLRPAASDCRDYTVWQANAHACAEVPVLHRDKLSVEDIPGGSVQARLVVAELDLIGDDVVSSLRGDEMRAVRLC